MKKYSETGRIILFMVVFLWLLSSGEPLALGFLVVIVLWHLINNLEHRIEELENPEKF